MAKTRRATGKRMTTRGIVKEIDRHIKAVQKAKKGAEAPRRKRMDLHLKKLKKMRAMATADCDAFVIAI